MLLSCTIIWHVLQTKWNSLSFPGFLDPLNSLYHTIITLKPEPPYQPFRYLSCSNAKLQNIFLRSMVTGSTHASHCVTQPIYYYYYKNRTRSTATVTKNYYTHKSMPKKHSHITNCCLQKIPEYISNFPEFSRIKKIPEFSRFSRVVSILFYNVTTHTHPPDDFTMVQIGSSVKRELRRNKNVPTCVKYQYVLYR